MALLDDINMALRDFEVVSPAHPAPTGDPASGRHNIRLHELRELLITIAQTMGDPSALASLVDEMRTGRVYVLPTGTPTGKTLPTGTDGILTATGGGTQFWVPTTRPAGTPESATLQRDSTDQWWVRAFDSLEIDGLRAATVPAPNQLPFGTFVGGDPWLRTPTEIVGLTQPEVQGVLYPRGIKWPTGQSEFAIWRSLAEGVLGKYVFGAVIVISANPANLPAAATVYQENASGTLTALTSATTGYADLAPTVRLIWRTGRAMASGTRNTMVGAAEAPVDDTRFATGFYLLTSDVPFDTAAVVEQIKADQKRLAGLSSLTAKALPGVGRFVYQGAGDVESFVTGSLNGVPIRRVFRVDPSPTSLRPVFNFLRDEVNGEVVRVVTDDVAPQRVWGATVGANHGWAATTLTAASHGKTVASQGAIYANGGKQWMLMRVVDGSTLIVTEVGGNSAGASGAYTYVSGPGPTGTISATAAASGQWYPSIQNRRVKAFVDGAPVGYGDHPFRDSVQVRETYEVAAKADLLTWWGANGGVADPKPNATAAYAVSNSYVFDREGQCTIPSEITALASVSIDDLMFLQAQRAGASDYYIPKSEPFSLGGQTLDYANVESADLTSAGGLPSVFVTPARMETSGLAVDRVLALFGASHVFAVGFLPRLAAADDQRRGNTSVKALEIRGGTDKIYMAGVDKGTHTLSRGQSYAVVGYRNIVPKPTGRTSSYIVRVGGDAYLYADWHSVARTDRLDIPAEMVGRPLTVIEARNATVLSGSAAGEVIIGVSAVGDYAYVVIKIG